MKLPTLSRPTNGEVLYVYIAVTHSTVSAVILREEGKQQQPIYFISHTLGPSEKNYPLIEKAAYAVVIAARKLRPYFESHPVTILTNQPLEKIFEKFENSGRLLKWAVELSSLGISYSPRPAIKAQALADFLAECSYQETATPMPGVWEVYVDGSATNNGSGAGIVLISPDKTEIEYALRFTFPASNNEAEYEAAIAGLEMARAAGAEHVILITDSQLVSSQINGEFEIREESMVKYEAAVKHEASKLKSFEVRQIPRAKNGKADALSKLASSSVQNIKRTVYVDIRKDKSINFSRAAVCPITSDPNSWMTPVANYKVAGILPADLKEASLIKRRSSQYCIINNELYKKSHTGLMLKCIDSADADYILKEIHEGICGHHIGSRSLAHKALRAGYYWPTIMADSKSLVKKCKNCQIHAPTISVPARELQPILNPIPFAQWGMDILGPFTLGSGSRKFLIVAVDYFSKWIEAEAVPRITEPAVRKVIWQNVITRFGVPQVMVFDHGRQFWNDPLQQWLSRFNIKYAYSAVCHPQSNGMAEAANKQILNGLKKKLDDLKGRWADELAGVLWSIRTTEKESTGSTPFNLVYGAEAVLPCEAIVQTLRTHNFEADNNAESLKTSLDLLEETRNQARNNLAVYHNRIKKAYNRRVHHRHLYQGDLVLRKAEAVGKAHLHGKLSAKWEGPYIIKAAIGPSTFILEDLDGHVLPSHWNTDTLKIFFV